VTSSLAELDGAWVPVDADISGRELSVTTLRVARLVIAAGRYRILARDNQTMDGGEVRPSATQAPGEVDLVGTEGPSTGRIIPALFELTGERLRLCYDLERASRPASMTPEPEQLLLRITYERVVQVIEASA
jgi:uncharacterized protein (TIGR03067 family)